MAAARPSGADLTVAADQILVTGQLFDADGPAGMEFVRADTDFRAQTELKTIGESLEEIFLELTRAERKPESETKEEAVKQ